MFEDRPALLRLFNHGNQANGDQAKALAASIVSYAVQLVDPNAPSFDPVLRRIAYKHISLGIRPEQYLAVGSNLIRAIGDVLGDATCPMGPASPASTPCPTAPATGCASPSAELAAPKAPARRVASRPTSTITWASATCSS